MSVVCITGAKGFIGSHLYKLHDTTCQILCCDPRDSKMIDPKQLINVLKRNSPNVIYHLGAISSTTETNIEKISTNNIQFSCELLEYCIKESIPFVYASSASVYGLGSEGFCESAKESPLNYYAISKTSLDMFVKQKIIDHPEATIVGLRYFNVYGQNEHHKGDMASPIHKFIIQAKSGEIKVFEGSEKYLRDFVYVGDVAKITKESVNFKSGIYNVGTGNPRSFLEVAEIISKETGAQIKTMPFPKHLKGKYQSYTCSDNRKINTFCDIERISLESGIKQVMYE